MVKNLPAVWETRVRALGWEVSLEKGMAAHSSFLAWRIPLTEEPGGLHSVGWQRVGHDWVTNSQSQDRDKLVEIEGERRSGQQRTRWLESIADSLGMNLSTLWETVEDRGALSAAVHGVAERPTWLGSWTATAAARQRQWNIPYLLSGIWKSKVRHA